MYVCLSFRHIRRTRVKIFASKFIRPYMIKTLHWISFIFGMKVNTGLMFYAVPTSCSDLDVSVTDLEFSNKSQNFCTLYSYIIKTL